MKRIAALLAFGALVAGTARAPAQAHELDNGRLDVVFADPNTGLSTDDSDRVDEISWIASDGTSTGNLAANGGPLHCNDPQEFFGESYGESGDAHPYLVIAGDTATWTQKAGTLSAKTKVETSKVCDAALDGGTSSTYSLSTKSNRINQLTVMRQFTFSTVNFSGNIRAYVPRLPLADFATVYWPNAAGAIQTGNAGNCPFVCEVSDWNGIWFAEENSAGIGLVVIRNPAKGLPAVLAFDNDSYSSSNNSSVSLVQPTAGWSGKVAEKQNLCFYDATTWPASRRAAGKLPTGCSMP